MKKTAPSISAAILLLCMVLLPACSQLGSSANSAPVKQTRIDLLGTVISITLYEDVDEKVFDEAFAIVADIDARMSTNNASSEILALGHESGRRAVAVSEDTYQLIERAIGYSELCEGAFDITIGSVMQLWKTGAAFDTLPDDAAILNHLPLVNYKNIILSDDGVLLAKEGMQIDLGAIAKGYACDMVLDFLKSRGIKTALLDFGGNIYVLGEKAEGSTWKLGIRSPIVGENEIVCTVAVKNASIG